jgi:hypothetical protein
VAAPSKPKSTLYEALLAFQKEGVKLQKNAINPHFGNKYISLDTLMEQVLPLLSKNGFVLLQFPTSLDGVPALRTQLMHVSSSGYIEDTMPLSLDKSTPQGQGSAITYARRYALMSILGLVADVDDDANAASPPRAQRQAGQVQVVQGSALEQTGSNDAASLGI